MVKYHIIVKLEQLSCLKANPDSVAFCALNLWSIKLAPVIFSACSQFTIHFFLVLLSIAMVPKVLTKCGWCLYFNRSLVFPVDKKEIMNEVWNFKLVGVLLSWSYIQLHAACINRNSRFGGGTQQDSHELFRCLLDGMRTEESEVCVEYVVPLCTLWTKLVVHSRDNKSSGHIPWNKITQKLASIVKMTWGQYW